MLILILDSILIVLLFTPFGLILSNENQKNLDYFSTQLLYGLIIISFIALSLNFILPLNKNLNSLIKDYENDKVKTKLFDMNSSEDKLVDFITNLDNCFIIGMGNMVGWGEKFLKKLKEYSV